MGDLTPHPNNRTYPHNPHTHTDPYGLAGLTPNGDGGCSGGPNGKFHPSPKHDELRPGVGVQPTNGQNILNESLSVGENTTRRIGVDSDANEIVIFDETRPGIGEFHGHVRTWEELNQKQQAILRKFGLVKKNGKIK